VSSSSSTVTPTVPREGSLNEVRAAIPASCYERPTRRAAFAVAQGAVLWAVPLTILAVTNASWWSIVLIALAGMGVAGLFVLGHDASHGALFASSTVNKHVARWCMAPSLHNEAAWDLGHNRIHHGYTARVGFDFVWHPSSADEYRAMSPRHRLRHRLEWSCVGAGAYYLRAVWWEKMMRYSPEGKRAVAYRRDNRMLLVRAGSLVAGVVALGLFQGGVTRALWLVISMLVIPFLMFCQVMGWTVYVHHVDPSVKWWPRREWNQFKGQMESTTVLEFPKVIDNLWLHHIFVHTPHHVDMRIPFHQLPAAARAIEAAFPGVVRHERWSLGSYLRATNACKLYDADAMAWTGYPRS
jgi:acyl-lipid omega-6 desaturase (Delta-12 desaturase)